MFSLLLFKCLQTVYEWFASTGLCDDYTHSHFITAIIAWLSGNCQTYGPFVTFPVELRNLNISATHQGGYFTAAGSELQTHLSKPVPIIQRLVSHFLSSNQSSLSWKHTLQPANTTAHTFFFTSFFCHALFKVPFEKICSHYSSAITFSWCLFSELGSKYLLVFGFDSQRWYEKWNNWSINACTMSMHCACVWMCACVCVSVKF